MIIHAQHNRNSNAQITRGCGHDANSLRSAVIPKTWLRVTELIPSSLDFDSVSQTPPLPLDWKRDQFIKIFVNCQSFIKLKCCCERTKKRRMAIFLFVLLRREGSFDRRISQRKMKLAGRKTVFRYDDSRVVASLPDAARRFSRILGRRPIRVSEVSSGVLIGRECAAVPDE